MVSSVRRITPEQWQLLRDVRLRSLLDSPNAFGQRYEEASTTTDEEWQSTARASAEGNRRAWYIATNESGAAVGVVQARRRAQVECLLFSMWVSPEARRLGVGSELVDAVEDWGRSWGAERVILWVLGTNESALSFYDKIGFALLSTGPDAESGRAYGAFAMERAARATKPDA